MPALNFRDDEELRQNTVDVLAAAGFFTLKDVLDVEIQRMSDAYPVLERGVQAIVAELMSYLDRFENLHFSGRNGTFTYTHIHDLMKTGKDLAGRLANRTTTDAQ